MYLVFDIETVPDATLWNPPAAVAAPEEPAACTCGPRDNDKPHKRGCPANKKPKVPKADKDPFAPLYAHRPIAIGFVAFDDKFDLAGASVLGVSTYADDEAKLLTDFTSWVGQQAPTLVTFGGRRFDMQVIALRSYYRGIPLGWFNRDYRHKYGEDKHLDLMDLLTDYGNFTGFSLDSVCNILGLPAKGEVNGAQTSKLYGEGHFQKIEAYCLCDAVKQAFAFLRLMLLRGRLTLDTYRTSARRLLDWATQMQLHGVTFGADPKRLLLE